ncbi:VOC family protein [Nonomuraea rubra]
MTDAPATGLLHHVELWVPDLRRAVASWQWLLEQLGYTLHQNWADGRSWRLGETYLVIEQSPALTAAHHDRRRPGLNHLAFHAGTRERVDALVAQAPAYGWTLLFQDRHPHAGGEEHYAAYLEDSDGFEVELVAVS